MAPAVQGLPLRWLDATPAVPIMRGVSRADANAMVEAQAAAMREVAGPPDASGALRWFAVWTRSRHEQMVLTQLEQKGVDAFLPTVMRWSRWKDRRKQIAWPLFPGYCFVRIDPALRLPVLTCAGVVNIVAANGELAAIPGEEIESIRRLVASELAYDPCPFIREGMMVEVTHGPLQGVRGRLVRKGARARLVLSVELIGQAVSVEVDAADVKAG
jgi:transcription antitermination factor NusG